ncbi:Heat shock factor (HSF)-type [Macleaya cordata]|uniref:Heat shock factor (HSF)-type n=1 Tax=Macleaya cordata TaxID=56857 RepID=A0A200PWD5_MACCD|nr:Heat shock factor (HSF)-type [Macleaya cordata]
MAHEQHEPQLPDMNVEAAIGAQGEAAGRRCTGHFINNLYSYLQKGKYQEILEWRDEGRFIIKDGEEFRKQCFFICGKTFAIFIARMNEWGFTTIAKTDNMAVFYSSSFAADADFVFLPILLMGFFLLLDQSSLEELQENNKLVSDLLIGERRNRTTELIIRNNEPLTMLVRWDTGYQPSCVRRDWVFQLGLNGELQTLEMSELEGNPY